jgi:hypothetical protein
MTILLQWLVDNAWIFYVICLAGALIYLLRALAAQRERSLSVFTLERETATSRVIQSWVMVLVFLAIGVLLFVSTAYILPDLPMLSSDEPTATPTLSAGVEPPTVGPTPSEVSGVVVPTFTPAVTGTVLAEGEGPASPEPTEPVPAEPTGTPTVAPTEAVEEGVSGDLRVQFGDFALLTGYSLPATEFTPGEPVPLTLYWQALEATSSESYLVFTHLLSEGGQLIAQHDGMPAGGTRPTDTWTPGERIVDLHSITFVDSAYVGPASISVGLYNPASGRVVNDTGGDSVILPVTINIIGAQ